MPPAVQFSPSPFVFRDATAIPRRQFVYSRHLVRGFVSTTIGPPGIGKTSLSLTEALAMAAGRDLLGFKPPRALRVWYINLEDPREEIGRRLAAICLHYGIKAAEIEGRLYFNGREIEVIIAQHGNSGVQISKAVEDALFIAVTRLEIDVLVVDPFVSTHSVLENDNTAIDAVAKIFGRIAGSANCAIELVHHVRKTGAAEITAEDGRGGSALMAAARSVRVLNRMSEEDGKNSGVGDDYRFYFRTASGKANLAPPSTKAAWYQLRSVALGNGTPDAPFEDGDHVGVVASWKWPDVFDGLTAADLKSVQARIAKAQWRESPQAKDWAGRAVAEVLGFDLSDRSDAAKIRTILRTWISKGALVVVDGKDAQRRTRKFIEVGTAPTIDFPPPCLEVDSRSAPPAPH